MEAAPAVEAAPGEPVPPAEEAAVSEYPRPAMTILPADGTEPHIALILPLKSRAFGKAAEAVQQGFLAAAAITPNSLPVLVYPCANEATEVSELYLQALLAGAVAVAGPLTRDGVAALAASGQLSTPTLALNILDEPRDDQLYFFGLPAEIEARQTAPRASDIALYSVSIIHTGSSFSKRLAQAFADEWVRLGGYIQTEIVYRGNPAEIRELTPQLGASVFIAAEVESARRLRPFVDPMLPVYSTSQIFSGNANTLVNFDISDVRFVDMPWMLQPDHPAVMIYPRAETPMAPDMERLYALGIDSWRLLQVLFEQETARSLPLDGVTGRITLSGHLFQREAILAIMRAGQGLPLGSVTRP
jgi:outer membrane PBP1 activator LpoA protein